MVEMESSKQGGSAGNGPHVVVFGCNPLMRGLSQTENYDAYHDHNGESDPRQVHRNLPLICENSEVTSMEDDETLDNHRQEERRNIHSRHGVDHHRQRLDINQENFDLRIACTTKSCQ